MNAELLGIIVVGIILVGVGVAFVAQSEVVDLNINIVDDIIPKQFTSSTRTDTPAYCEQIPTLCR